MYGISARRARKRGAAPHMERPELREQWALADAPPWPWLQSIWLFFWVERLPQRAPTNQSFASYSPPLTTLLTTILNPAERTPRLDEPSVIRIISLRAQGIIVRFILQLLEYFGFGYRKICSYLEARILHENGDLG